MHVGALVISPNVIQQRGVTELLNYFLFSLEETFSPISSIGNCSYIQADVGVTHRNEEKTLCMGVQGYRSPNTPELIIFAYLEMGQNYAVRGWVAPVANGIGKVEFTGEAESAAKWLAEEILRQLTPQGQSQLAKKSNPAAEQKGEKS